MEKKPKKENTRKVKDLGSGNSKEEFNFKSAISELEEISFRFQQPDIDLDEGLKNLKRGQELIVKCQKYLANAENEFEKINHSCQI